MVPMHPGSCSSGWRVGGRRVQAGDAGKDQDPRRLRLPAAAPGTMARVAVPCHIKSTVALQVGDMRTSQGRPGVLVIDVTFPSVPPFEVSEPRGGAGLAWPGLAWQLGCVPGVCHLLRKASRLCARPCESVHHLFFQLTLLY